MIMAKQYDFNNGALLTAYVADVSYFSGKLEAYLRYKEIPYKRRPANVNTMLNEVYANTGMMKMPAVRLHDGKWLKDTTPMLQWFDQQKPAHSIYPEDPVTNFIALLIEIMPTSGVGVQLFTGAGASQRHGRYWEIVLGKKY
jgi:glutathione S-transferase